MAEQKVAVSLRNVTVGYGDRIVQNNISFDIHAGEIVAILGGSGCGKSTLLKAMIGLIPIKSGDILIDGQSIIKANLEEKQKILHHFGVAFQNGALFRSYTLAENIALPLEEYTDLTPEEIDKKVKEKLEMVSLGGFGNYYPADLSGGMLKRGAVARALALDPPVIFLDEPSAGLDPLTSNQLDQLILNIRDKCNSAIAIVTHELPSIFAIADTAVFLDNKTKTLLAIGNPEELREHCPDENVRLFLNRGQKK